MPPATIDQYLAGVPDDKRAALERLRQQIHAAAPDATEAIGYGLPAFRLNGRYFLGFGAAKRYCTILAHAGQLAGYRLWKGTIDFQPNQPLPAELVTKLVQARVAETRAG